MHFIQSSSSFLERRPNNLGLFRCNCVNLSICHLLKWYMLEIILRPKCQLVFLHWPSFTVMWHTTLHTTSLSREGVWRETSLLVSRCTSYLNLFNPF